MKRFLQTVVCLAAGVFPAFSQSPSVSPPPVRHAAPTPPPVMTNPAQGPGIGPRAGGTLYSIGNPTDEEQLYLEYINRARANPPAEGLTLASTTDPDVVDSYNFFNVDLALMQSQFNAIAAAPPLSMNSKLTAAARLHSGDMFTNMFQGHTNSFDGRNFDARLTNQGYSFSTAGENVYSYASSVFHGHAGFEVDWGPGPGGMQTPPGHRNNIHNAAFREIGVGVVLGSNGSVGPQLVTQDLATAPAGGTPFITGIAYYDFNTNGFYDLGEGLAGVTVVVTNSTFYAVTTNSGGYSVPVAGNGTYTVTFSGNGLTQTQRTVSVTSSRNVKVDFIPVYSPPVITGPAAPSVGISNHYTFTAVGGANSYQWKQTRIIPFTAVEGAESGLTTNVTAVTSAGYPVIATDVKASGTASFHLATPDGADQFLTLNRSLLARTNSQLSFSSRLGWASSSQTAAAQVSIDGGSTWQDVRTQAGTGNSGEGSFSTRTVSLAAYAGREIHIRFAYTISSGGSYFPQTSTGVGWYIDNISFSNVDELTAPVVTSTTSTAFDFVPGTAGSYLLQVAAQNFGRSLNSGPAVTVTAVAPPASVRLSGATMISGSQIQVDLLVQSGTPGGFEVQSAPAATGPWGIDGSASVQTIVAGVRYRVTAATSGTQRYYKVRVLP